MQVQLLQIWSLGTYEEENAGIDVTSLEKLSQSAGLHFF